MSCKERGFRGRVGLFELLPIDDELARRIVMGSDEAAIKSHMRAQKIRFLQEDALEKLLSGETSYSELIGVTQWGP
jgi:type II secretory ATPase GspE/PulE/Tfp pilus assembly ATPase PilB-like protein